MIEDRNLKMGDRLIARYKGQDYRCRVENYEGQIRYILDGDPLGKGDQEALFKSPSAAGSAIMGGVACNGWRFWSVEGQEPAPKEPQAKDSSGKKAPRMIKRTPNQQGTPEGQVRWFCSPCMNSFLVAEGEKPGRCPEGHSAKEAVAATA